MTLVQGVAVLFKQHMRWYSMSSLHRMDCLQTTLGYSTKKTGFKSLLTDEL